MTASGVARLDGLPPNVATVLSAFLASARDTLSADLVSTVLLAALPKASSDPPPTSISCWSCHFTPDRSDRCGTPFWRPKPRSSCGPCSCREQELSSAAEFFAQKFADILRRHRIVYGQDVLSWARISTRGAEVFRLRQNPARSRPAPAGVLRGARSSSGAGGSSPGRSASVAPKAAAATLLELEGLHRTRELDRRGAAPRSLKSFRTRKARGSRSKLLAAHGRSERRACGEAGCALPGAGAWRCRRTAARRHADLSVRVSSSIRSSRARFLGLLFPPAAAVIAAGLSRTQQLHFGAALIAQVRPTDHVVNTPSKRAEVDGTRRRRWG